MAFGQGCASNPKATDDARVEKRQTQAEKLYASVIEEFKAKEIPLYIEDEKKMLIISDRLGINAELRKRYIARVISVPQGLAFNLTVEYERRDSSGDQVVWVKAEDRPTLERAHREEQSLGKAIQGRFKD